MKPIKSIFLIAAFICLTLAISCKHTGQAPDTPVFASIEVRVDGPARNTGPNYVLSENVGTAMIAVIPEKNFPLTSVTDVYEAYDLQLMNLVNNSASVTVPLETPFHILKVTFESVTTIDRIKSGIELMNSLGVINSMGVITNPPTYMGVSKALTIDADTKTVSVTLDMDEMVFAISLPPEGVIGYPQNYPLSVAFSHSMLPTSITVNGGGSDCTGTVQISKDDFSTCVGLAGVSGSASNEAFILAPSSSLESETTYKIKIQSGANGVASANGSPLSIFYKGDYISPVGFTTGDLVAPTIIGGTWQGIDMTLGGLSMLYSGAYSTPGTADGDLNTVTRFNSPYDIKTGADMDGSAWVYVADRDNHSIRMLNYGTNESITIAGTGSPGSDDNATGTLASFNSPSAISIPMGYYGTTTGYLFVADTGNHTIRRITLEPPYEVTTIAGAAGVADYADGDGTAARFNSPYGIFSDDGKYLFVADRDNNAIRKVLMKAPYTVSNLAGSASVGGDGDTDGIGTAARFNSPTDLTASMYSTALYVVDMGNNKIRVVDPSSGTVTTKSLSGIALNAPRGITTDGFNLFVANTGDATVASFDILTGVGTVVAGAAASPDCTDGQLNTPKGMYTDGMNLFVANSACHTINVAFNP